MLYFLQLVVIPLLVVIYLDMVGRWISHFFNVKMHVYFPIGFVFLQALLYITSPLIYIKVPFNIILLIFLATIIIISFLIVKDFKKIDHNIEIIDILIAVSICLILSYFSYTTTLGNLNGFDSIFYLNLVSQNIKQSSLNNFNILYNQGSISDLFYYFSETYYYYGAVLVYIVNKVFSILKLNSYYSISFIWIFQILFNLTLGAIVAEGKHFLKNKISFIIYAVLIVFVIGKLYYNSVFGFFGNSWIIILLSYACLFLYQFFRSGDIKYRYFLYICLFALCSFTTSGIFIMLFFLYALLFFLYKESYLLKEYSIVIFLPILNALLMERYNVYISLLISVIFSLIIFVLGNKIQKFLQKKKIIVYLLILSFFATFILSRMFSNGLFDFSGLLNNRSQSADMTLDYFSFNADSVLIILYKAFVLITLLISFILNRRDILVKFALVLVLIFFNPFCCNFINHYVSVYYRAYSIIVNPITLILLFDNLISFISPIIIRNSIGIIIVCLFVLCGNIFKPIIYNYEFIPDKDYNGFYRMNNDEINIINELKNNINYYCDTSPYIITNNILTLSMIPQGKYMYCRGREPLLEWSNAEKRLYEIFYEPDYLGDTVVDKPDYNNMNTYIKDANINYLVINKSVEIYDEKRNIYTYLFLKVNEVCNCYPIYENDNYVLYRFENV